MRGIGYHLKALNKRDRARVTFEKGWLGFHLSGLSVGCSLRGPGCCLGDSKVLDSWSRGRSWAATRRRCWPFSLTLFSLKKGNFLTRFARDDVFPQCSVVPNGFKLCQQVCFENMHRVQRRVAQFSAVNVAVQEDGSYVAWRYLE